MLRCLVRCGAALCIALPAAGQATAPAPLPLAVRSLQGIDKVALLFEAFPAEFLKAGADSAAIRKTMEAALREQGIAVDDLAQKALHVTVRAALTSDGAAFAYSYRLDFKQPAYIASQRNLLAQLPTWGTESVGTMRKATVADQTAKTTVALIGAFVKDWMTANGKESGP